jgi:hypothetical protein
MRKYPDIPELLEAYMEENGADERWITVHELRDRFGLTRYQSNTVSPFLRRLEFGPFSQYPFIVAKIERADGENPSDPKKCRYLLKLRQCTTARQRRTRQQDLTIREPIPVSSIGNREHPV